MAYSWPSIVQLVVFGLVALLSVIQAILGIVVIVAGYWPGIGGLLYALITLGYCILIFVAHKRSHVALLTTKSDIIIASVLCVVGLIVAIFCGIVGIGTFVLLLGITIFESVYVGTRKISGKWTMTLYDLADVDVTGGSVKQTHQVHQPQPQQFA
ncbi:hypothetical protein CC85DRAFT_285117 [Cutaneotrichosporon oleaginosum]|uniref:Uncharacterized protein n=1 Tax=Cutaneotrichosporon oleaginosum TaxID=879819 RepID=A0A0J0XPG6_9TREE|nr:uncharacterized protein CC85DRAFT_285117 [Cutaneotrichosporon oleaginosum]KLT42957.1 hypothetical protein CC85DRAFT_285117 [Cutaneotrichosporon oleaginosum]TXT12656.1 hypothetical protein COLE_03066 [Cutaneotrichosporon oleaginosum]